jgi:hypothetical protein
MLAKLLNRPLWTPWIVILALLIANFTIATLFGNLTELPPRSWQTWSVIAIVGWAFIGAAINLAWVNAQDQHHAEDEA